MPNTPEGLRKAREKFDEIYGPEARKEMGSIGGSRKGPKGFGSDKVGPDGLTGKERASAAAKKRWDKKKKPPI